MWFKKKSQGISKVTRVRPLGTINVWTKFLGNPSNRCWDISVGTKTAMRLVRLKTRDWSLPSTLTSLQRDQQLSKLIWKLRQAPLQYPKPSLSSYCSWMGAGPSSQNTKQTGNRPKKKSKVNKEGLNREQRVIDSTKTGLLGYVDWGLSGREISDRFNSLHPTWLCSRTLSAFI